jgi:hypothetical protein
MRNIILRVAVACSITLAINISVHAQANESKKRKALRITGKVSLVVTKAATKAALETVKFTGKHVIVPAFKHVVVPAAKAAPPLTVKAAKLAARGIKHGVKALRNDAEEDEDRNTAGTKSAN